MKRKSTNISAMKIFQAIMVVLPLFVENRYFNIVEAKAHMLTLICAMAWLLIIVETCRTRAECLLSQKLNALDISVMCIAVVSLASCLCSGNLHDTFWGLSGWGIGGFILISFSALYIFLSRNISITYKNCVFAAIVLCVVAYMSVAHSMNKDVIGFHTGIASNQYYDFKSTLGNLNAHVGYSCLLMPVCLIFFVNESKQNRAFWELVVMIALLCEIAFACTDSVYLGIGICSFLAIPYVCRSAQRLRRTFLVIAIYGVIQLLAGQLECFAGNNAVADGIVAVMRSLKSALVLMLVGACGYIALRLRPQLLDGKSTVKVLIILFESLVLIAALFFVRDTVTVFSDDWGTNRGKIWRVSVESFNQLPFGKKLIGVGPEMQQIYLEKIAFEQWRVFTCHSEPIQILLSMGIFGILTWFAVYATAIYNMIHSKIWESDNIAYALPIVAYLGQSLVASAMATNVGIFCIILALYRKKSYNN